MGNLLDLWLHEVDNLELWIAEDRGFPMWKKRVIITHLLAQAWDNVCKENEATQRKTFEFLGAAKRMGHNMTVDGSNDARTQLGGIVIYSFSDADGGAPGDDNDVEGAGVEDDNEADKADAEDPDNDDDISEVRRGVPPRVGASGAHGVPVQEEEDRSWGALGRDLISGTPHAG